MMKKLVSVLILSVLVNVGLKAQDANTEKSKQELRNERKEQRRIDQQAVEDSTKIALTENDFTLRGNTFQSKLGPVVNVDNNVNFVAISGDQIVVQLGNLTTFGYNGVGGITYKGRIQDLEVNESKGRSGFTAKVVFNSPNTINTALLRLDVNGDNVSARFINGSNQWVMRGYFERTSESNIFVSTNRTTGLIF
ncbi:MAG: DUF4251 domain-containing protein [Cytophagia bacterium]|nr:DUF4251 domain-containing protein [Cytophagia bacterium]